MLIFQLYMFGILLHLLQLLQRSLIIFWPIPNYHHGLLQPLLLSIHPYPHVKFLFIDN